MTGYGSLFERLGGYVDERAGWSREDAVVASVAANLAKMLSTRAGSVQTLPDYGLPDLNDMRLSLHDSLAQARVAIKTRIEAYEPRLSRVLVHLLPRDADQLHLSFNIEGLLQVQGLKCQVIFTASLNGKGQIKVFRKPQSGFA